MVYKVLVDLDEVDLNKLVKNASKQGIGICISDDCLYFHMDYSTPTKITNVMKRTNIKNFVLKEVTVRPEHPESSFADLWCFEKMNADAVREFNEEHQAGLQKMMDNIESIRANLIKDKLLKKEEPNGDGRTDSKT